MVRRCALSPVPEGITLWHGGSALARAILTSRWPKPNKPPPL